MSEDVKSFMSGVEIEDSENFFSGAGNGIDIKQIVLSLFNKALQEGSKEMSKGGVQNKLINGRWTDVEIPNQREIFINSVSMVQISVVHHFLKSKLKGDMEQIDEKIETLNEDYNTEVKKLNEEDKRIHNGSFGKMGITQSTFMDQKDIFEMRLVSLYRKKLEVISLLLKEINYFNEFDA